MVDHLSHLEPNVVNKEIINIDDSFSDKTRKVKVPWCANYENYLVCEILPNGLSHNQKM